MICSFAIPLRRYGLGRQLSGSYLVQYIASLDTERRVPNALKRESNQKPKHAENKVEKLISEGAEEITVCDPNTIHNLVREDDEYYYELG